MNNTHSSLFYYDKNVHGSIYNESEKCTFHFFIFHISCPWTFDLLFISRLFVIYTI